MTVRRTEVGLVAATDDLVAFYRDVFGLDVLEPRKLPTGVVHRLGHGDAMLKILVPATPPASPPPPPDQFWDVAGMRYFTLWVDTLDTVAPRCAQHGGVVTFGPIELRPGVHTMLVQDPDGNVVEVMEERA
jgi:catechol 2,3-dioxygenase-like lactoylglutathione lyase family enzyme